MPLTYCWKSCSSSPLHTSGCLGRQGSGTIWLGDLLFTCTSFRMLSGWPPLDAFLRSLLRAQQQSVWGELDICPRTTEFEGARRCAYARWFRKPQWCRSSVLRLPLTRAAMQRLLRFRTGCHGLPRDLGSQQGVARRDRICPLCRAGVGDEMHLVFECTALQDLRNAFAPIFEGAATMQ